MLRRDREPRRPRSIQRWAPAAASRRGAARQRRAPRALDWPWRPSLAPVEHAGGSCARRHTQPRRRRSRSPGRAPAIVVFARTESTPVVNGGHGGRGPVRAGACRAHGLDDRAPSLRSSPTALSRDLPGRESLLIGGGQPLDDRDGCAATRLIQVPGDLLSTLGPPQEPADRCNPQAQYSARARGSALCPRARAGFEIGRRTGRSRRGGRHPRPVARKNIPNPAGGRSVCSTRTGSSQGEAVTDATERSSAHSSGFSQNRGVSNGRSPPWTNGKRRTCIHDPQPDRRWLNWLSAFGRRAARGPAAVRERAPSGRFGWASRRPSPSPA